MAIVYKTTNNVNGKIYIGVYGGTRDDYYGSGSLLRKAFSKYGKENFSRQTLYEFDSLEEAYKKEAEIVDLDFIKRDDTYNLQVGGKGGRTRIISEETRRRMKESKSNISEETRQKMSESAKKRCEVWTSPTAKGHTQEAKEKMSKTKKERGIAKGKNNPMYGKTRTDVSERNKIPKRWMYKGTKTKLVPIELVDEMILDGYNLGRPI